MLLHHKKPYKKPHYDCISVWPDNPVFSCWTQYCIVLLCITQWEGARKNHFMDGTQSQLSLQKVGFLYPSPSGTMIDFTSYGMDLEWWKTFFSSYITSKLQSSTVKMWIDGEDQDAMNILWNHSLSSWWGVTYCLYCILQDLTRNWTWRGGGIVLISPHYKRIICYISLHTNWLVHIDVAGGIHVIWWSRWNNCYEWVELNFSETFY